jgi:amino acid transporter
VGGALFFSTLNFIGARESAAVQVSVTVGKVLLSVVFILIGLAGGRVANWTPLFEPAAAPLSGVAAVLVMVPAWFCGFNALPQVLDEAEHRPSAAAIARLMAAVIVLTTLFYIGVITATAAAAPRALLRGADLPVVAAIEAVAGPPGGRIVLIAGVVALLSAWNAAMFAASRLLYALGRAGALPRILSDVHPKHGTPRVAVLFVGIVALSGGLMGRAFIEPLVRMGAIGFAVAFVATCVCSLMLRRASTHLRGSLPTIAAVTTTSVANTCRVPPLRGSLLTLAAVTGTLAISGVILLSLYRMFAVPTGWPAEATALAGWVVLGLALWVFANRERTRLAAPTES